MEESSEPGVTTARSRWRQIKKTYIPEQKSSNWDPVIAAMQEGTIPSDNNFKLSRRPRRSMIPTTLHQGAHTFSENVSHAAHSVSEAVVKKAKKTTRMQIIIIVIFLIIFVMFILWFHFRPDDFAISNNTVDIKNEHGEVIGSKERTPSWLNGVYFFTTTLSSVGYGDCCPASFMAKLATSMFQMYITVISLGAIWYFADGRLADLIPKLTLRGRSQSNAAPLEGLNTNPVEKRKSHFEERNESSNKESISNVTSNVSINLDE